MRDLRLSLPLQLTGAINRLADNARMDGHEMAVDLLKCGLDHYDIMLGQQRPSDVAAAFAQAVQPLSGHTAGDLIAYTLTLPPGVDGQLTSLAQATQQPRETLAHQAMAYAYRDWTGPW